MVAGEILSPRMQRFRADDGEDLHYVSSGSGPAIVMLHGWTASHSEWAPLVHALSAQHTVLRWDARAHGGHAPVTRSAPTVQRMARDLENFLSHLGLDRPTVVGHSMGALTVWEHIRAHGTGRLGRLCLVDQSPRLVTDGTWHHGIYGDFDVARSEAFIAHLREDFPESVLRLAAYGLNARARHKYEEHSRGWRLAREALRRLPAGPLIEAWESLVAADYRDVLPRIDVPTLLVHGGASNFYTLQAAWHVRDRIPGARLLVYEDADHSPHLCAPDRFVRDLADFARG